MAVSFGLVTGERARRCVDAASAISLCRGAAFAGSATCVSAFAHLRTPWPVERSEQSVLGRYEGEEDTRRKPLTTMARRDLDVSFL
jgi:hypothetical protein